MAKEISVVIPTLQKNKELLINLINILETDSNVNEIILIDNSLKGFDYDSKKLKIITPKENLFVNPSWNLGVKIATNDNIALLNDDITIPNNFCSSIFNKISDDIGVVGYNIDFIKETHEILPSPQISEVNLIPIPNRCMHWGVAIFFKKSNYVEIPEDLKIFCGDDWLIYQCKKQKKGIYSICGQEIYHYGSLTSGIKTLNSIAKNDKKIYKKLTGKWWQNIINIEILYKGIQITLFTIKFTIHLKRKNNKKNIEEQNLKWYQKIFSIKNTYINNLNQNQKQIYILGIRFTFNNCNKSKFLKVQKNIKKLELKLIEQAKNRKINIAFMVSMLSMFPARPLFEYLIKNSNNYNIKIIITPDFRFGNDRAINNLENCYQELKNAYGEDYLIKVPIDEQKDIINISEYADILFCAVPYDVSHKKYNLKSLAKQNILLAMVNYGVIILPNDMQINFKHKRLGYFWKIFYETKNILDIYKKYSIVDGTNGILSGYLKMDRFVPKKISDKKTILICPHHSVQGGSNDVLNLSNFYKYADLFLRLPDMYPNINWIFRPHPALFPCLEQDNFWGKEKITEYLDKLTSKSNVRYSNGGDYFNDFNESNGIIQDCSSFLFEYFYTCKPQCYMIKPEININEKFGNYGSQLLNYNYLALSEQDIVNFIETVVLDNNDSKFNSRLEFAKKEIMINYPSVAHNISNYLDSIFNQKEGL